jgi:hypothetical protein
MTDLQTFLDMRKEEDAPAPKQKPSGRLGGIRLPFHHRCYSGRLTKEGWTVKNSFTCHLLNLPLSFTWTEKDLDGVKRYIDALMADRVAEARFFEEKGFARDLVYPEHDPTTEMVKVTIQDFVDFLLMRGHICMPAHRRISFVTHGNRFIPVSYITAISQLPGLEYLVETAEQWQRTPAYEPIGGLKAEEIHTGLGLERPEMSAASLRPAPPAPPTVVMGEDGEHVASVVAQAPESEIIRKGLLKHFELVTCVRPRDAQLYFVRRLATYGGELLWAGTSFGMEGPWTEYVRENALLIGLGIEP